MKAVILAAGQGARMRPFTLKKPKPLLEIYGKPLLGHIVERLPKEVTELILVVGYLGQQIVDYCGREFLGRQVKYVWQSEKLGTFHALKLCRPFIEKGERFFVLYADDIHGEEGIKKCLEHDRALIVEEHKKPWKFGVVKTDKNNRIIEIIEKPKKPSSNLVSTGVLLVDSFVFEYDVACGSKGEYYLSEAVSKMTKDHEISAVKSTLWLPVGYPDDLLMAEDYLRRVAY